MSSIDSRTACRGGALQSSLGYLAALQAGFLTMNVAPVITLVIERLDVDRSMAGTILVAGVLSHTLVQPLAGHLVDHLGTRRALALGALVGALSCLMTAMAFSLEGLILARLLTGVSSGIAFIAGLTFVSGLRVSSPSVRQGVFGACNHLGIMLAMFSVAALELALGWAGAFVAMAAALLVVAAALALFLQDPEQNATRASVGWQELATDQRVLGLALTHTLGYGVYMTVIPWTVDYLVTTFDRDVASMAFLSTVITVSALLARVGGGYVAKLWGEGRIVLFSMATTVLLTGLLAVSGWMRLSIVALVGLGVSCNLPFGSIFSLADSRIGKGLAGRAMSLISLAANSGALILPIMIGQLAKSSGGFSVSFMALAGVELAIAISVIMSPGRRRVLLGSLQTLKD
ncbi:MAG: MFS transporter [Chloroflexota bacterium]